MEIKEILDTEVESLKKGDSIMPKIFAETEDDKVTMIAFADFDTSHQQQKQQMLMGLGIKLFEEGNKLKKLTFVSDTYTLRINEKKKYPEQTQRYIDEVKSGRLRISDIPDHIEIKAEAIIVTTNNNAENKEFYMLPYKRKNNTVEILEDMKDISNKGDFKDGILSWVWKGYDMRKNKPSRFADELINTK